MTYKKFIERYCNGTWEVQDDGGVTSREFDQFARDFKSVLKEICSQDWEVADYSKGHYFVSSFLRNASHPENYLYVHVSDIRYNPNWYESILYRTAENEKDYRGGGNRYASLGELSAALERENRAIEREVQKEFEKTPDDNNISQTQIQEAEEERKRITEPVLSGTKGGLYSAFKTFEEKGVFEIKGQKVDLDDGQLTESGWKQLEAAMEIYRNKKFETFRYVLIDRKSGEILDQLAISAHMPNFCLASLPNNETLKQVITQAEKLDCLVAVCHNHPSGNTKESLLDQKLTLKLEEAMKNQFESRFAGHIILDHGNFNLYIPDLGWKLVKTLTESEKDPLELEEKPEWAEQDAANAASLLAGARKIDGDANWNDDYIPVAFTNIDNKITAIQYYGKDFFKESPNNVRNGFMETAMDSGTVSAFPIVTDSLLKKLPEYERTELEAALKNHVENNAFTDAVFGSLTITEKFNINPGEKYNNAFGDMLEENVSVQSTWNREIDESLFKTKEPMVAAERTAEPEAESYGKNDGARAASEKLDRIIHETFLTLTESERNEGLTEEAKRARYENWQKPIVDEIKAAITDGNPDVIKEIEDFSEDRGDHKSENSWQTDEEAFRNDVTGKLLPELYGKVQEKIKAEFDEKKIPYVQLVFSESRDFGPDGKVYSLKEFNEILTESDSVFHNRRTYAAEKYGSADRYWELENEEKIPDEDKGIRFGYDKTEFKIFNIPNLANPGDTITYEPGRYDIGDGHGSVFDYIRATCSHDSIIEGMNSLEEEMLFPHVADTQKLFVERAVTSVAKNLKENASKAREEVILANELYKKAHDRILIDRSELDAAERALKESSASVRKTYDDAVTSLCWRVLNEYPFAPSSGKNSEFMRYIANAAKKMVEEELYRPTRESQKAMNKGENFEIDWVVQHKIWGAMPSAVNLDDYTSKILWNVAEERGISVSETREEEISEETALTEKMVAKYAEKAEKYKDALKVAYKSGEVSDSEREKLDALKNELGLSEAERDAFEKPYILAKKPQEKGKPLHFNDICDFHNMHLCDAADGGLRWETIDHSDIEYLEVGDTYIEKCVGGGYGISNAFISIGGSIEDLYAEYGENHFPEEAVKDGKVILFDRSEGGVSSTIENYIRTRFNILSAMEIEEEYTESLGIHGEVLKDYIKQANEKEFYDVEISDEDAENLATLCRDFDDIDLYMFKLPFPMNQDIQLVEWDEKDRPIIQEIDTENGFVHLLHELHEHFSGDVYYDSEVATVDRLIAAFNRGVNEERYLASIPTFEDDREKMEDFFRISKDDFLLSYSYLTEREYDATAQKVSERFLQKEGEKKEINLAGLFNGMISESEIAAGSETVLLSSGNTIERSQPNGDSDVRYYDMRNNNAEKYIAFDRIEVTKIAEINGISYFKTDHEDPEFCGEVFSLNESEVNLAFMASDMELSANEAKKEAFISYDTAKSVIFDEEIIYDKEDGTINFYAWATDKLVEQFVPSEKRLGLSDSDNEFNFHFTYKDEKNITLDFSYYKGDEQIFETFKISPESEGFDQLKEIMDAYTVERDGKHIGDYKALDDLEPLEYAKLSQIVNAAAVPLFSDEMSRKIIGHYERHGIPLYKNDENEVFVYHKNYDDPHREYEESPVEKFRLADVLKNYIDEVGAVSEKNGKESDGMLNQIKKVCDSLTVKENIVGNPEKGIDFAENFFCEHFTEQEKRLAREQPAEGKSGDLMSYPQTLAYMKLTERMRGEITLKNGDAIADVLEKIAGKIVSDPNYTLDVAFKEYTAVVPMNTEEILDEYGLDDIGDYSFGIADNLRRWIENYGDNDKEQTFYVEKAILEFDRAANDGSLIPFSGINRYGENDTDYKALPPDEKAKVIRAAESAILELAEKETDSDFSNRNLENALSYLYSFKSDGDKGIDRNIAYAELNRYFQFASQDESGIRSAKYGDMPTDGEYLKIKNITNILNRILSDDGTTITPDGRFCMNWSLDAGPYYELWNNGCFFDISGEWDNQATDCYIDGILDAVNAAAEKSGMKTVSLYEYEEREKQILDSIKNDLVLAALNRSSDERYTDDDIKFLLTEENIEHALGSDILENKTEIEAFYDKYGVDGIKNAVLCDSLNPDDFPKPKNVLDSKYAPLPAEKLIHFINIAQLDSFDTEMADECLKTFVSGKIPLVYDELGNVYQRNIGNSRTDSEDDFEMLNPSAVIEFYKDDLERQAAIADEEWFSEHKNTIDTLNDIQDYLVKIENTVEVTTENAEILSDFVNGHKEEFGKAFNKTDGRVPAFDDMTKELAEDIIETLEVGDYSVRYDEAEKKFFIYDQQSADETLFEEVDASTLVSKADEIADNWHRDAESTTHENEICERLEKFLYPTESFYPVRLTFDMNVPSSFIDLLKKDNNTFYSTFLQTTKEVFKTDTTVSNAYNGKLDSKNRFNLTFDLDTSIVVKEPFHETDLNQKEIEEELSRNIGNALQNRFLDYIPRKPTWEDLKQLFNEKELETARQRAEKYVAKNISVSDLIAATVVELGRDCTVTFNSITARELPKERTWDEISADWNNRDFDEAKERSKEILQEQKKDYSERELKEETVYQLLYDKIPAKPDRSSEELSFNSSVLEEMSEKYVAKELSFGDFQNYFEEKQMERQEENSTQKEVKAEFDAESFKENKAYQEFREEALRFSESYMKNGIKEVDFFQTQTAHSTSSIDFYRLKKSKSPEGNENLIVEYNRSFGSKMNLLNLTTNEFIGDSINEKTKSFMERQTQSFLNLCESHADEFIDNAVKRAKLLRKFQQETMERKFYDRYVEVWKKEHEYEEGVSEPASFGEFLDNEYLDARIMKDCLSEELYKDYAGYIKAFYKNKVEQGEFLSFEEADNLSFTLYSLDKDSVRPSGEQILTGLEDGWDFDDACNGYMIANSDDLPEGVTVIMRLDDMQVFGDDHAAALQAEKDGIKLIPKDELDFRLDEDGEIDERSHYDYIDTPENRKLLKEAGLLRGIEIGEYVTLDLKALSQSEKYRRTGFDIESESVVGGTTEWLENTSNRIKFTREDGETFFDLIDDVGTVLAENGEEVRVVERKDGMYKLIADEESELPFTFYLSDEDFEIATGRVSFSQLREEQEKNAAHLEEAKRLISDFCFSGYMSTPDFEDLRNIGLAYTDYFDPVTQCEYPIQVSVNLVEPSVTATLNGKEIWKDSYKDLKELNELALANLDFESLVSTSNVDVDAALKDERDSLEADLKTAAERILGESFEETAIKDVKLYDPYAYGLPEDNKIHILIEVDSKSREDSLFNALNAGGFKLPNGKEVDFNPITPQESGTIEEYLEHLKSLNEKERHQESEKSAVTNGNCLGWEDEIESWLNKNFYREGDHFNGTKTVGKYSYTLNPSLAERIKGSELALFENAKEPPEEILNRIKDSKFDEAQDSKIADIVSDLQEYMRQTYNAALSEGDIRDYLFDDEKLQVLQPPNEEWLSLETDETKRKLIKAGIQIAENPQNTNQKENEMENNEETAERKTMPVYTFSPFGYEGALVQIETDLRRGIPAYDIVGISDGVVKETRERIRAAFRNSDLDFPAERVLQSASPADLKKEGPLDLAMAVGILAQKGDFIKGPVMVLGSLELSGQVRPVRGATAAVRCAVESGIKNIVCDPMTAKEIENVSGIRILEVRNLSEANAGLKDIENFRQTGTEKSQDAENKVEFTTSHDDEELPDIVKGNYETVRAMEIAAAGKHNILITGAPGCGKTILNTELLPKITPRLTLEESFSKQRIWSIAGLYSPKNDDRLPSIRMPHPTASIEGMFGGGEQCRPGEISLAHHGILFLDEAAEFKTSVLQMLRIPLENRSVTLSRAGRSTVYPADLQLSIAMNPCPCGNKETNGGKLCLDSEKSIDQYWGKLSSSLLDKVEIKNFMQKDENDKRETTLQEMRERIATAIKIQRERGVYNSRLSPQEVAHYCEISDEDRKLLENFAERYDLPQRSISNTLKVALTVANMDGRTQIRTNDLKEAMEMTAPVFEKPREYHFDPAFPHGISADELKKNISFFVTETQEFRGEIIETDLTAREAFKLAAEKNKNSLGEYGVGAYSPDDIALNFKPEKNGEGLFYWIVPNAKNPAGCEIDTTLLEQRPNEFVLNEVKNQLEEARDYYAREVAETLERKTERAEVNARSHSLVNSTKGIEITPDDLKYAKTFLPKSQYSLVLQNTTGEEGEHFKEIIKNIADKARSIEGKSEIVDENGKHPLAFKYTFPNDTKFYISEWNGEDEVFGYTVLKGDTQMSEWGYSSLREIRDLSLKASNGFPVTSEMTFYGLETTIEKMAASDYPELASSMGEEKKSHEEEMIAQFSKEMNEAFAEKHLEPTTENIPVVSFHVMQSMDSSEKKEIISLMEKCGCTDETKANEFLLAVKNYGTPGGKAKIRQALEAIKNPENTRQIEEDEPEAGM